MFYLRIRESRKEKSLMKLRIARLVVATLSLVLSLTALIVAQTSTQAASALPRLVRFGGTIKDLNGNPLTGVVGVTFALYSEPSGDASLWLETQNVTADSNGHYVVLLGSTKHEGLPAELFTSEQARWVGVQVSGQAEQPRVLLVSAAYALKAGDAETIGGLPPSAFVLAAPAAIGSVAASSTTETVTPLAATDVTTTGGTADYLPIFSGADTIIDSVLYQAGTGGTAEVGINTTTPATTLDVNGAGTIRGTLTLPSTGTATAAAGSVSQGLNFVASSYSSTSAAAVSQTFRWLAEPAGNNTASPSGTLNLLYGLGPAGPSETGLHIASNGQITFASGQTFPTVTGNEAVSGNISSGGSVDAATGFDIGGQEFATGSTASGNVSLGFSAGHTGTSSTAVGVGALQNNTGAYNTASGYGALHSNTTGSPNTAYGYEALYSNTTASGNTAVGNLALKANTSGIENTAVGDVTLLVNTSGSFNTAFGYQALNAMATNSNNTAVGDTTLFKYTGNATTAVGSQAGFFITSGNNETAVGYNAMEGVIGTPLTGDNNTAVGYGSLAVLQGAAARNTALGFGAGSTLTTGTDNIFLGANTAPSAITDTLENVIGSGVTGNGSDTTTIGGASNTTYTQNLVVNALLKTGNTVRIVADSAGITATTPATATAIFALPKLVARTNYSIHCSGTTTQATAGAGIGIAVAFGTTAPTNAELHAQVATGAAATAYQSTGSISTTTATAIYAGTTGTITKQLPWYIDGSIEVGATAPTSIAIGFYSMSSSDSVVVKRDSFCSLMP